jgi:hypothetical protein
MTSEPPKSRDARRMVERIVALAEAYGAGDLEHLADDLSVVLRVEYLAFDRQRRTAYELKRRVAIKCQPKVDP